MVTGTNPENSRYLYGWDMNRITKWYPYLIRISLLYQKQEVHYNEYRHYSDWSCTCPALGSIHDIPVHGDRYGFCWLRQVRRLCWGHPPRWSYDHPGVLLWIRWFNHLHSDIPKTQMIFQHDPYIPWPLMPYLNAGPPPILKTLWLSRDFQSHGGFDTPCNHTHAPSHFYSCAISGPIQILHLGNRLPLSAYWTSSLKNDGELPGWGKDNHQKIDKIGDI